jgi:predicted metal-dependent hydrolase
MNKIEVIRSKKRKNTVQAKVVEGKLCIYLPSDMTISEENKWIEKMIKWDEHRQKQKQLNDDDSLQKRAQYLNKIYYGNSLDFSIKFVKNQKNRFGSCAIRTKSIRISDRLVKTPKWVLDYVIIHELTHILYPNHSNKFWEKVNQYKYAERARGYLIAIGMLLENK